MPDPMTIMAIASLGSQLLGGFFGDDENEVEIPPELRRAIALMEQRSQQGFGEGALSQLRQTLTNRIGNEFAGLGANAQSQIARAGGGLGVQQQALQSLNSKRLNAIGEGTAQIDIANEQNKFDALRSFGSLSTQLAQLLNQPEQDRGGDDFSMAMLSPLLALLNSTGTGSSGQYSNSYLTRESGSGTRWA